MFSLASVFDKFRARRIIIAFSRGGRDARFHCAPLKFTTAVNSEIKTLLSRRRVIAHFPYVRYASAREQIQFCPASVHDCALNDFHRQPFSSVTSQKRFNPSVGTGRPAYFCEVTLRTNNFASHITLIILFPARRKISHASLVRKKNPRERRRM